MQNLLARNLTWLVLRTTPLARTYSRTSRTPVLLPCRQRVLPAVVTGTFALWESPTSRGRMAALLPKLRLRNLTQQPLVLNRLWHYSVAVPVCLQLFVRTVRGTLFVR